jgi:hypothetical protein
VSVYPEPAFLGKTFFQAGEIVSGEVDYSPATGTYQVMVMLLGTHSITATASSGMYLADEAEFGKDFEGAINSHQSGTGTYITYFFIDIIGSQVII